MDALFFVRIATSSLFGCFVRSSPPIETWQTIQFQTAHTAVGTLGTIPGLGEATEDTPDRLVCANQLRAASTSMEAHWEAARTRFQGPLFRQFTGAKGQLVTLGLHAAAHLAPTLPRSKRRRKTRIHLCCLARTSVLLHSICRFIARMHF